MIEPKKHLKGIFRTIPKKRTGCIRMDMNESVDGLPDSFIRTVVCDINPERIAGYPEYQSLAKKIAKHNSINPENICPANGSDGAIKYIFDAYISPGDKILITDPTFAMYPIYGRIFNADVISVKYGYDLEFPSKEFIEKMSRYIKMAVVVNPNNPAGSAISQKDLAAIIKKAEKNNILLVVDEAYFYYYPKTIIKNIRDHKNLIVLRTFSKLCGMAGLRIGYAAACPEIIENLRRVKSTFDVNGLAVLFTERLLDNPDVIRGLIDDVSRGKRYMSDRLSRAGIEHKVGLANFILIRCGDRTEEIIKKLSGKNILLHDRFKQDILKDYMRVAVGSEKIMKKFWSTFISIWKS